MWERERESQDVEKHGPSIELNVLISGQTCREEVSSYVGVRSSVGIKIKQPQLHLFFFITN